jgi:hypothetical protein
MKRPLLSLCLLCGLGAATAAQAQTGLIGINTDNPQGILHIDGASTTGTANPPPPQPVTAAQAVDDVVVDNTGRLGAGLLNPAARVDLSASAATPVALRIHDTTQEAGAYLFSDDNGTGVWAQIAVGGWYAALYDSPMLGPASSLGIRPFNSYAGQLISSVTEGAGNATAGTITVPATGKYRITLSIYWETTLNVPFKCIGLLRLTRSGNTTDLWTFSSWAGSQANENVLPTFIKILNLNKDDILSLATDEQTTDNPNNARARLFLVERQR